MTCSEVNRGVPRSPNGHLDQLRIFRQFNIAGRKIELNGFSDVFAGLLLGFSSGCATGEFGTHGRVITGLGIMFQNDSEGHIHSIGPPPQRRLAELGVPSAVVVALLLREHLCTAR